MNRKPECVEMQSRLVEHFSEPPGEVPEDIARHLANCDICRNDFEQMQQALETIRSDREIVEAVPVHLLAAIETEINQTPQLERQFVKSSLQRNLLILQYSYLASMAVIIWLSIMLIQPIFNDWLSANQLPITLPLLAEYGLFILFFAAGGIFAAISSPLIIQNRKANLPGHEKVSLFRRFFSGLRMFAC
ncbi:MAG: hypothetical protein ACOYXC_00695 [Candidatus Rifleibacteriota bacterium]